MKNNIIVGIVVALVAGVAGYLLGHTPSVSVTTSPTGSTFSTAKTALVAINLANPGSTGTSTSILNTDSNDRYITSVEAGCTGVGTSKSAYAGVGLAALTLTMATSSTAAPATNGNVNTLQSIITIGTSTPNFVISSSTAGGVGNNLVSNIWASGSYLTITSNATNTAVCTAGVKYFGS